MELRVIGNWGMETQGKWRLEERENWKVDMRKWEIEEIGTYMIK